MIKNLGMETIQKKKEGKWKTLINEKMTKIKRKEREEEGKIKKIEQMEIK